MNKDIEPPSVSSEEEVKLGQLAPSTRILMVSYYFPPQSSGAGMQALTLAKTLLSFGCKVQVVTSKWGESPDNEEMDGIAIHRLPPRKKGRIGKALWSLRLLSYFIRQRKSFDILHFHGVTPYLILGDIFHKLFGKPAIYKTTLMGSDDPLSVVNGSFRSRVLKKIMEKDNTIICVSPAFMKVNQEAGLFLNSLVYVPPNGVDTSRFKPLIDLKRREAQRERLGIPAKAPIAVFIGVIMRRKRVELLIEAWPAILEKVGPAYLLLVGPTETNDDNTAFDSSYVTGIRNLIKQLGLTEWVKEIGFSSKVESYLQVADLFLFASSSEGGLPNVLLEAMACGVPPCVVNIQGIDDALIQNGVNGIIVDKPEPKDIAEAVIELFSDSEKRRAMGQAARRAAEEKYDIKKIAGQYHELYRRLLSATSS